IQAGEVLGHELGSDRKSVLVYAFVKSPFDQLIRSNTRFWNVSGVDVALDADGLQVRTESISSVLFGGVAFETPLNAEP
ncbi:MAG: paraquat-inducible protein B, partial [Gammaproteobacteria bacterium]